MQAVDDAGIAGSSAGLAGRPTADGGAVVDVPRPECLGLVERRRRVDGLTARQVVERAELRTGSGQGPEGDIEPDSGRLSAQLDLGPGPGECRKHELRIVVGDVRKGR